MTIKVPDTSLELREMTGAEHKEYVNQAIEQGGGNI